MEMLLPLLLYITLPLSAYGMIAVSLTIGVFIAGGMYAIAYALQNPQLHAVAKEELAALLFSVFIIMFWLGSDAVFNGVSSGLLSASLDPQFQAMVHPCSGQNCVAGLTNSHVELALASLDIIYQKLKAQYMDLYLFEALIGFLSTLSFPLGTPIPAINAVTFTFAPFTGLVVLSNIHTQVVESISYLITVIWAKQFLVLFARDVVPLLLLPLGLVMRAFPFTRTTGSSIIALSFAAYFVLPFSIILSNYLIFDVFKPADFSYTPSQASFFSTQRSHDDWLSRLIVGRNAGERTTEQFTSESTLQKASKAGECGYNEWTRIECGIDKISKGIFSAAKSFVGTMFSMWKFMLGMSGDFFYTFFNNPAMPTGTSAGLFYFILREVLIVSPFIILVTVATVFEVIFTVTMYRDISLLIGGEAELIGLTKVV